MSFSVSFVGKPEAVKRKLFDHSAQLSGQSKDEFDAVVPALCVVLDQNVGQSVVSMSANGHATFVDGVKTYGVCSCDVRTIGQLAE